VWSLGGVLCCHSVDDVMLSVIIIGRCAAKASHIMKIIIMIPKNEIKDPMEDTIFQVVKTSG
jgi:hypothetical protein